METFRRYTGDSFDVPLESPSSGRDHSEPYPSVTPRGLPQPPNPNLRLLPFDYGNHYSGGYISPVPNQHFEQSGAIPTRLSSGPSHFLQEVQHEPSGVSHFGSQQYGSESRYDSFSYDLSHAVHLQPSFPPSPVPHYPQRNDSVSAFSGPQRIMGSQYSGDESSSPRPLSFTSEDSDDNIITRARLELDQKYAVIPKARAFFKFGRVFKTLWSEPAGGSVTRHSSKALSRVTYGEFAFSKIRRFVVVRESKHHSICLPIQTYEGKGTAKRGISPKDHAVIFTGDVEPQLHPQEPRLQKLAIGVIPVRPSEILNPMSRVNFTKFYTVEHTVKVYNIGKVAPKYAHRLERYFLEGLAPNIHSLSRSPERPDMDQPGYIHPIKDQEDLVFSAHPPEDLDIHDSDADRNYSRKPRATWAPGRRNTSVLPTSPVPWRDHALAVSKPSPSYTSPRNQFDRRRNTSPTLVPSSVRPTTTDSTERSERNSSDGRRVKGRRHR